MFLIFLLSHISDSQSPSAPALVITLLNRSLSSAPQVFLKQVFLTLSRSFKLMFSNSTTEYDHLAALLLDLLTPFDYAVRSFNSIRLLLLGLLTPFDHAVRSFNSTRRPLLGLLTPFDYCCQVFLTPFDYFCQVFQLHSITAGRPYNTILLLLQVLYVHSSVTSYYFFTSLQIRIVSKN